MSHCLNKDCERDEKLADFKFQESIVRALVTAFTCLTLALLGGCLIENHYGLLQLREVRERLEVKKTWSGFGGSDFHVDVAPPKEGK